MTVETLFLNTSVAKMTQFGDHIAICLGRLTDDQIWSRGHENENAVGNLVLHLSGNVRQWIMHGLGGQPDIRVRDGEFSAQAGFTARELATRIRETIAQANAVIAGLSTAQLTATYEIQTRSVTGLEAVLNVVEHFARHTGQIVYATKNMTREDLALFAPRQH